MGKPKAKTKNEGPGEPRVLERLFGQMAPTATEARVLELLLKEMRRAEGQLQITIDPWISGRTKAAHYGVHVVIDHGSPVDVHDFDGMIWRSKGRR